MGSLGPPATLFDIIGALMCERPYKPHRDGLELNRSQRVSEGKISIASNSLRQFESRLVLFTHEPCGKKCGNNLGIILKTAIIVLALASYSNALTAPYTNYSPACVPPRYSSPARTTDIGGISAEVAPRSFRPPGQRPANRSCWPDSVWL